MLLTLQIHSKKAARTWRVSTETRNNVLRDAMCFSSMQCWLVGDQVLQMPYDFSDKRFLVTTSAA